MKKDQGFYEYIANEVFAEISGIASRPMFGGWGFYRDGLIFAIIADGKLYFKVGESNKAEYEKKGSKPFVYEVKNNKPTTMNYWELPEEIMEDKAELEIWINKSLDVHKKK